MALTSFDTRQRNKNRAVKRLGGLLMTIILLCGAGGLGYMAGKEESRRTISALDLEIQGLSQQRNVMEDRITELIAEVQTLNARYQELMTAFKTALPEEGPLRDLLRLVQRQLQQGVHEDRLAYVLRSVQPPRNCSTPETRRFIVSTPAYKGPESVVSVADGEISIRGKGVSVRNANGQPEAWYDPAKPVAVSFARLGSKPETREGTLPLHYAMIVGEREYRFTVAEGARSFAEVTFDSCDYP